MYQGKIPKLSGAEWLEHRLVYGKYFGVARDDVLVRSESGGRYFGEPIRLHETDHISIVKPDGRDHRTYRAFRYFYRTDFLKSVGQSTVKVASSSDGAETTRRLPADMTDAAAIPPRKKPSPVEPPLANKASVGVDEKRSVQFCDGDVSIQLKSVWRHRRDGKPGNTSQPRYRPKSSFFDLPRMNRP